MFTGRLNNEASILKNLELKQAFLEKLAKENDKIAELKKNGLLVYFDGIAYGMAINVFSYGYYLRVLTMYSTNKLYCDPFGDNKLVINVSLTKTNLVSNCSLSQTNFIYYQYLSDRLDLEKY